MKVTSESDNFGGIGPGLCIEVSQIIQNCSFHDYFNYLRGIDTQNVAVPAEVVGFARNLDKSIVGIA